MNFALIFKWKAMEKKSVSGKVTESGWVIILYNYKLGNSYEFRAIQNCYAFQKHNSNTLTYN